MTKHNYNETIERDRNQNLEIELNKNERLTQKLFEYEAQNLVNNFSFECELKVKKEENPEEPPE